MSDLPPGLKLCKGCNTICADPEEFPAGKKVCIGCVRRGNKTRIKPDRWKRD